MSNLAASLAALALSAFAAGSNTAPAGEPAACGATAEAAACTFISRVSATRCIYDCFGEWVLGPCEPDL